MEDGGKEDTAKPKEVKFTGKAGWLKKSSGKIFGTYKDRYIQLEHTEIGVYENEDLNNCLERFDLENYDKCHELRGGFKKKNRLILIRAPKCANKVNDVKLQAQSQEDKEAWIKALSDGINRAKNKIFDEVKVDEGCSLEHVTRTRPKGNRGRRPPTRIHMKEVANVSSDGILRLDLDITDSRPNGTHYVNIEDSTSKEGVQPNAVLTTTSDHTQVESTSEESTPQKKILKPPMPPSKQSKPVSSSEDDTHGETTSDSGLDTGAPPTPSKPSSSQDDVSSDSFSVDKDLKPPKPPSKDKKPTLVDEKEAEEAPEGESGVKDKEDKEEAEDKPLETIEGIQDSEQDKPTDTDDLPPKNVQKPSSVTWDSSLVETASEAEEAEVPEKTQSTPEPLKKSSGPPAPPKKPIKCPVKSEDDKEPSDAKKEKDEENESSSSELISDSTEPLPEAQPETNTPSISFEPLTEDEVAPPLSASEESVEPGDVTAGKTEREEEKSIDSGQHSAEESDSGDATTTSAAVLLGSQSKLDGDSSNADETDLSNAQAQNESEDLSTSDKTHCQEKSCGTVDSVLAPSVRSKVLPPRPLIPLKPKMKVKSASVGDLLTESSEEKKQRESNVSAISSESDMKDLQSEVTLELKNTGELLHTIADKKTAEEENQDQGELTPEVLLATAMEKLRKAEKILRVATSFKEKEAQDSESKRKSW